MTHNPKSEQGDLSQINQSKWRISHFAFVVTVLSRYWIEPYEDRQICPTKADIKEGIKSWGPDDWTVAIEEGRRQLDGQFHHLRFLVKRATILLSIGIAGLLFLATNYLDKLNHYSLSNRVIFITGVVMMAWGTAVMGALVGARSSLGVSDAFELTGQFTGVRRYLARDYAKLVRIGENTNAARLTHLGTGISWMIGGVIVVVIVISLHPISDCTQGIIGRCLAWCPQN